MKKRDLSSLALIGISAGLIAGGCQQGGMYKQNQPPANQNENQKQNQNQKQMSTSSSNKKMDPPSQKSSEMQSFYASLSPDAKKQFDELDARHKMMAIEMAHQQCKGENKCKGMGGCKTQNNACAGQNGCQGEGGPPVRNPNKAVQVQYQNQMAQQ